MSSVDRATTQAFVIMQIGAKESTERKRADETFNYIVKPALDELGLTSYRADLDPSPGAITPKLLSELISSRLVIADLTGRNPNVFYELGIAHSYARPLISIADSVRAIPFDAKDERVIELGDYPDSGLSYAQGESAKASLLESLKVVLAEGYQPPSPLREVANTTSLDALAPDNPVAAELAQIREALAELQSTIRPRSIIPPAIRADLAAMRAALEELVQMGTVPPSRIPELVTDTTSPGHDTWARELREKAESSPWEGSVARRQNSDPWAEALSQDEPPF